MQLQRQGRTQRTTIAGCDIAWEAAGEGPAVLFLHAAICQSDMWDDQWHLAAAGYRLVRMDLPGAGRSAPAGAPYDAVALALGVLDGAGIERAVVVGASMGGSVALDLALAHPGRVAGLVLAGAGFTGLQADPTAEEKALNAAMEAAVAAKDVEAILELDLLFWVDGFGRTGRAPAALRERVRFMDRVVLANGMAHPQGFWQPTTPPAVGRLGEVQAPVLVTVGAYDASRQQTAAGVLAHQLARARFVCYPDAAHLPSMEVPDAFNRDLVAFLQSLGH